MKIVPLAADSLGVRSMATYVEAGSTGVLIDPGATLAAARFGLPPAEEEWTALRRANDRISAYAAKARYVFVSHYHEDHFRSDPAFYAGHVVLAKDPRRMISGAQARRAQTLWAEVEGQAHLQAGDGRALTTADVDLAISPPLPHGTEGTTLGYLIALVVVDHREHQRFVFASDVQGPLSAVAAAWLIQQRPTTLYLSGPPSYLEREVGTSVIERGIEHLCRVQDATGCRVIMDHYALRDPRWATRFERLWERGRVVTAAGHLGLAAQPLEARRERLWAAVRKPPAKATPGRFVPREARRAARGGGVS
ncbi:MAG TPA: MBL fold metallo-hydrolase [Methylomirabilota bacterium]|nr:MBL fold metallo-hydrolase [Methylomirabilota bacterium]